MKIRFRSAPGVLAGLLLLATSALADKPAAGSSLDLIWTFIPKRGMEAQFQQAFAEHIQWRRANRDPWSWEVYTEASGPEAGAWFVRSPNHAWADFDAYDASGFGAKAAGQWNATVAPCLAETRNAISLFVPATSRWREDAPDYQIFQWETIHLKQDMGWKFRKTTKEMAKALEEAKWPHDWAFFAWQTGPFPAYLLVLPALNWAGFEESGPNIYQAMASVRGEEAAGKLWSDYESCIARRDTVIVQRLPQYTVTGAK